MEEIISKEELDKLMKIEGEVRGVGMKGGEEFILKEKGEEGLKQLEEAMAKLGCPIKYKEIESTHFYPLGWEAVTFLVFMRLFNFDDEKIQEAGGFLTKTSLFLRLFMKYFVSLQRMIEEVPKIWRRSYTVGDLKVVEFNEEKRYVVLRLENFRVHPFYCQVFIGYFQSVLRMIVRGEPSCEETKCVFRGDPYHEFLLKW